MLREHIIPFQMNLIKLIKNLFLTAVYWDLEYFRKFSQLSGLATAQLGYNECIHINFLVNREREFDVISESSMQLFFVLLPDNNLQCSGQRCIINAALAMPR